MSLALCSDPIDQLRDVVRRRFGLNVENANRDRLVEALQRALVRTADASPEHYVHRLDGDDWDAAETAAFVEDVTVAETYFFRHPDHFRAVIDRLIVERRQASTERRLRILSAGCASGEEAYSLAILVDNNVPREWNWSIDIRGIDINPRLLARAARAHYTAWSLRGLSPDIQQNYFRVEKGEFLLNDSARRLVRFEQCNLADDDHPIWQPHTFDLIFCRNVIMYFTPEVCQSIIRRFARALAPGGLLFLGPVETLRGMSHDFHLQHTHDTFYYQRRSSQDEAGSTPATLAPAACPTCPPSTIERFNESWVETVCGASNRVASMRRDMLANGSANCNAERSSRESRSSARDSRIGEARQLVLEERFEEALKVLQSVLLQGGNSPDVELLSAALLTNAGRVHEAEQLCRNVLCHDELNAEAHYVLALCREHAGALDAAVEQNQMSIYLDKEFAMPHLHGALLAKRRGELRTASGEFETAATLLAREDASRIVLFGGGFGREALIQLCRREMRSMGERT